MLCVCWMNNTSCEATCSPGQFDTLSSKSARKEKVPSNKTKQTKQKQKQKQKQKTNSDEGV